MYFRYGHGVPKQVEFFRVVIHIAGSRCSSPSITQCAHILHQLAYATASLAHRASLKRCPFKAVHHECFLRRGVSHLRGRGDCVWFPFKTLTCTRPSRSPPQDLRLCRFSSYRGCEIHFAPENPGMSRFLCKYQHMASHGFKVIRTDFVHSRYVFCGLLVPV